MYPNHTISGIARDHNLDIKTYYAMYFFCESTEVKYVVAKIATAKSNRALASKKCVV